MVKIQEDYEGKEEKGMRSMMVIFLMSWLLCACSVESFFNGGAPVAILAALVAIAAAVVIGSNKD